MAFASVGLVAVGKVSFGISWWMSILAILLTFFLSLVACRATGETDTTPIGAMGKITQVLQETIEGYKVVKIFGGQAYEMDRFRQAVREQRGFAMRATLASAGQSPIVHFFAAIAFAIIIGVALKQASDDQTTVGNFVSFITAMLMLLPALRRITDVNAPIQRLSLIHI